MTREDSAAQSAVEQQLVTKLAALVMERAAPEEIAILDERAREYFADPEAALEPRRRDEPLGFGIDVSLLGPYVLAVASPVVTYLGSAILAAAEALGVIAGRDVLVPDFDQLTAMQPNQAMIIGRVIDYKTRTGLGLLTRRLQLNKTASSIATDPNLTGADRAARYRSEVVVPLRGILVDAKSYVPPEDRVATVHQHCIAALRLAAAANENLALGFELNNRFLLTQGEIGFQTEHTEWHTWPNEVSQL